MSCSSSTVCSHLSLPSCSSSSSRSSDSYKDVKTMFIARDINTHQLPSHHNISSNFNPPNSSRKTPIWTVAYSSATTDNCPPFYADPDALNIQRNTTHSFAVDSNKIASGSDETDQVNQSNMKRKTLFLFILPVTFIAVFLAVYHIIHMQKDLFIVHSNAKVGSKELRTSNNDPNINPNRNNRDSSPSVISFGDILKTTDLPHNFENIGIADRLDRNIFEAQFRISNKVYSRQLKNTTSDAFQKLSRDVAEKVKLLVNTRRELNVFNLDKVELISIRKGDNLMYNLNGIIVDLLLHFNRNVSFTLNEIALSLISAKRDRLVSGLEIEEKTLRLSSFSVNSSSEEKEKEHGRYKWTNWSEWGPSCLNERSLCDEDRVHSRARLCFDKIELKPVDEIYCIKVYKSQHQSLQIEDCACDPPEDTCLENEWKCLNSQCIPLNKRCDGHKNCYDSSDEENCICAENEIHCGQNTSCISIEKRCDNITDCWDNSDEAGCPGYVDYF